MSYEDMRRAAAKGREGRVEAISGRKRGGAAGQTYPGEVYTSDLRGTKGAPESGVAAGDTKGPVRRGAAKLAEKTYIESETKRARGGKVGKKGTTVNVIIAGAPGGAGGAPGPMPMPPRPMPTPGGMPPAPMGLGAPPGAPMPGGAPMPPPMAHKRGGAVAHRDSGGALTGVGAGGRSALARLRKSQMAIKG
jgi:hypothetical protein